MKRIGRWLFHGVTAISLLLFLATAIFWIRGYSAADDLYWVNSSHTHVLAIDSDTGHIVLNVIYVDSENGNGLLGGTPGPHYETQKPPNNIYGMTGLHGDDVNYQGLGFLLKSFRSFLTSTAGVNWVSRWWIVALPCWFVLILLAIAPAWWLIDYRRKTLGPGFCQTCGYDLRATPNQCPECGMVPKNV